MVTFFCAFLLFYVFHAMGITLGYHRLLSHRALKLPKLVEYFIVSGGYLAFEGDPIFWVTSHRLHHRYSDDKGDPHTPKDGFWHAFIAWMWHPNSTISAEESRKIGPDLYRDPVYRFLHCNHTHWDGILCLTTAVSFRVAIYLLFGPVVLAANLVATFFAFLGPLLVNTVSHMNYGYVTYPSRDDSRNVPFVAFMSLGEGWHNNHHAFPQSARHGLAWYEIDPTWMIISFLKTIGVARDVRLPKISSRTSSLAEQVLVAQEANKLATEVEVAKATETEATGSEVKEAQAKEAQVKEPAVAK